MLSRSWRSSLLGGALALFLCAPACSLEPEQLFWSYAFDYLSYDLQLPTENYDAIQGQNETLWIATDQGLAQVRGQQTHLMQVSEFPGLLSNRLHRLLEDSRGRIIALSSKGLSVLDNESFFPLDTRSHPAGALFDIAEDASGNIWVAAEGGLFALTEEGLEAISTEFFPTVIRRIDEDIWVAGQGFAGRWNGTLSELRRLPSSHVGTASHDIVEHEGTIWLATDQGALTLVEDQFVVSEEPALSTGAINSFASDKDGSLWFGGAEVFGILRPGGRIESPDLADEEFGFEAGINRLYEDERGTVWHVTSMYGMVGINDFPATRLSRPEGLQDINVLAIATDAEGRTWMGTGEGLSRVDQNAVPENIELGSVFSILSSLSGQTFVGTEQGLRIYPGSPAADVTPTTTLPERQILALAQEANGALWVGTDRGLFRRAGEENLTRVLSVPSDRVASISIDRSGATWVGTSAGLFRQSGGSFERIGEETLLGDVSVMALLPAGDSIVVATQDNGLFIEQDGEWRKVLIEGGMLSGEPTYLGLDDDGRLWVAGGRGLLHLPIDEVLSSANPVKPTVVFDTLGRIRGASFALCCGGSGMQNGLIHQGQIWLATGDGALRLETDRWVVESEEVIVYIDEVVVGEDKLTPSGTIALGPEQTSFQVRYAARTIRRSSDIRYRYRLSGVDDEWVDAEKGTQASYSGFPPGSYNFEVQASLANGEWGSSAKIELNRPAQITETLAFKVASVALGFLAMLAVAWFRLRAMVRKRAVIEAMVADRTVDLQSVNVALAEANEKLESASHTDPLTGLMNRRYLLPIFDAKSTDAPFRLGDASGLLLIDIDFFKKVNDRHGHAAGDEVLRQFSKRLQESVRAEDVIVRWGGEEFMVIARGGRNRLADLANRIHERVRSEAFALPDGRSLEVTCSVGAVSIPLWKSGSSPVEGATYVELADLALYTVKRNGRAGWAVISGVQEPTGEDRLQVVDHLKSLIDSGDVLWESSRPKIAFNHTSQVVTLQTARTVEDTVNPKSSANGI